MNKYRIIRREKRLQTPGARSGRINSDAGVYTVVEESCEFFSYAEATRYYQETYGHDDRDGTEILFIDRDAGTLAGVVRIERPQPQVKLIAVAVR